MIGKKEMGYHLNMKRKHPNYPKLPKVVLANPIPEERHKVFLKNPGHMLSVVRGFRKRVANWNK